MTTIDEAFRKVRDSFNHGGGCDCPFDEALDLIRKRIEDLGGVIALTEQHFRCPDCERGVTTTGDRCTNCGGTGFDTDTDFALAAALSAPSKEEDG